MSAIENSLRAGCIVVLAGPAADRKLTSDSSIRRTALHESAHCVAGYFLGRPATGVTIIPDQQAGTAGLTRFSETDVTDNTPAVVRQAAALDDERKVGALLIINDPAADADLAEARFAVLQNEADTLVLRNRHLVEVLADRLLEARSLTGPEIGRIIETHRAQIAHKRLCELGAPVCG